MLEELEPEQLHAILTDRCNPQLARAARAWAVECMQAGRMHPALAGDLGYLLAVDFITADLGWEDSGGGGPGSSSSERYKGRVRPGSAGDYVRYSDDECDSHADSSPNEEDGGVGAAAVGVFEASLALDLDDLFSVMDAGAWVHHTRGQQLGHHRQQQRRRRRCRGLVTAGCGVATARWRCECAVAAMSTTAAACVPSWSCAVSQRRLHFAMPIRAPAAAVAVFEPP
jgi:hypothetical protein